MVLLMSAADAVGQTPTYSMEAAAINAVRIPGGPVAEVTVAPGDDLRVEIYVRDWSPKGEQLNAYQAQIDFMGYSSGPTGFIEPVDYSKERGPEDDNHENCFVDQKHARFVHRGMGTVALTDSRSTGYRWLGVLLHLAGPTSEQDGKKFYCGTLNLKVSDNASGEFTFGFVEDDSASGLRHSNSTAILPMNFEALVVHVEAGIAATRPPAAAADLDRLVRVVNGGTSTPSIDGDLDGDGRLGPHDVIRAIELLLG